MIEHPKTAETSSFGPYNVNTMLKDQGHVEVRDATTTKQHHLGSAKKTENEAWMDENRQKSFSGVSTYIM